MVCYECREAGKKSEAVAICHHCSAGLCSSHARAAADPVMANYPVAMTVVLPRQARIILCETCLAALRQDHEPALSSVGGR